jgi:hypothetical protein
VFLRVEHDRDGPVVDELEGHAGAENACPDGDAQGAELVAERLVEGFGPFLWGSFGEVGPSSPLAFAIDDERELAHDERLAADVLEAQVEAPVVVLEDPKPRDAGGEAARGSLAVLNRDAEKDAETAADLANRLGADDDARPPHALDDGPQ